MPHSFRHPLRRSCSFCRARRIKCSNETICEACRKHNVECVYDWESRPSRAWPASQEMRRRGNLTDGNIGTPETQRQEPSTSGSASPDSIPFTNDRMTRNGKASPAAMDCKSLASELENLFQETFGDKPASGAHSARWRAETSTRSHDICSTPQDGNANLANRGFRQRSVKYTSILQLLACDLVGLVVDKFGSLGSLSTAEGGGRFYQTALSSDTTETMFETTLVDPSPLSEHSVRQVGQLVDVWYSVHPLSFLVSKTLLLRELRDGTHDKLLVAVILAEASFSIGNEIAVAKGHKLLRWATSQLQNRPVSTHIRRHGIGGTRISTAQTLMLLGWTAMGQQQIRRATCYIDLAGRLATEIKDAISAPAALLTASRINGIDVSQVEREIVAYLYWTTYTLKLWIILQTGGPAPQLLPTNMTSISLPMDETSSVLMRLDEVSDNFSTLQKQKSVIKDMWPLERIASVIAYILTLSPVQGNPKMTASTNLWPEVPLLSLYPTQRGWNSQDMARVCCEPYHLLMENIRLLNLQVPHTSSRSLVLAVYHSMAIHLLFPAIMPDASTSAERIILTADVIECFIGCAQELVGVMYQATEWSLHEPSDTPVQCCIFLPEVFCLAVDTCSKSLSFIYSRKRPHMPKAESQTVVRYTNRLVDLAARLLAIITSDLLTPVGQVRIIKKRLKSVMRAFVSNPDEGSSKSTSPDLTPDYNRSESHFTPPSYSTPTYSKTRHDFDPSHEILIGDTDQAYPASTSTDPMGVPANFPIPSLPCDSMMMPPMDMATLHHTLGSFGDNQREYHDVGDLFANTANNTRQELITNEVPTAAGGWFASDAQMVVDFGTGSTQMAAGWDWGSMHVDT